MELASWVAKIICVRVLGRGNIQQRDGAGPPGGAGHPPRGHITRDGPGTITPIPFLRTIFYDQIYTLRRRVFC